MDCLLDTHTCIWFFNGDEKIYRKKQKRLFLILKTENL
jgi:PIN domain nuclease of toxin-antitoxin system